VIQIPLKFYVTAVKISVEEENAAKKYNKSCVEHVTTVIRQTSFRCPMVALFFRK
jgi:hypothetical protein